MLLRDLTVGIQANPSPLQDIITQLNNLSSSTNDTQRQMQQMNRATASMSNTVIRETQAMNSQLNENSQTIRQLARTSGSSVRQMSRDWQDMSTDMRRSLIQNHNEMRRYRTQIMEVENDMRRLGNQMGHYSGSNEDFMSDIHRMGRAHRSATDQMINNNRSMRQGLIQTVATMTTMTGQSDRIRSSYDDMGNSLYRINNPLLRVTGGLERMARNGNATVIALRQLGPNASMKALQNRIMMINQGVMRMQAVLMVAAVAWVGFTAIMAKAALGPDVKENLAAQSAAWAEYQKELQQRTDEIYNTFTLFEKVTIEKTNPRQLFLNLEQQVKVMRGWQDNIGKLAAKGLDEGFIQELRKMGPAAAGEVAALTQMSNGGLIKYVAMWKEKHHEARTAAEKELAGLKKATAINVKAMQDSLTPLGLAWEDFKGTWSSALAPFVEFWGMLAAHVVRGATKIGEFVQKLNEISPWITKIGGMFVYLVSTFTLLLAPLAVGIGLIGGLSASFAAGWLIIAPFVTGLGAMMGTVLLVSAAVIGFSAALYLLWTRSETFRSAVISGWEMIKSKAVEVWGFLKPYINQAIGAIVSFGQQKIAQLRSFWNSEGQSILQAGKNIWSFLSSFIGGALNKILAVFKFIWPYALMLIKSVWGNIKGIINGALNIILGLVKIFSGLFTGDFGKMWEGIKQVFFGAIQFIWNFIQLQMFGKILGAGRIFFSGFKTIISTLWATLVTLFRNGVSTVRNFAVAGFTRMRNLLDDIVTNMRVSITTNFGRIVDAAKALPGKIGNGIKSMAGKAWDGIKAFGNNMAQGFGKIINGATGGINWVMGKLGIDFAIPEWPVPEYAKGTKGHPGGPAILGDGGMHELFRTPKGHVGLSPATDTMMNLPKGTQVLSGPDTQKVFNNFYPAYKSGNIIGDAISTGANWLKNTASGAVEGTKKTLGKVKDIGLDVFNYLSNPTQLMDKVLGSFGFGFPADIGGAFGNMGRGAMSLVKSKVIDFVKGKMAGMAVTSGGVALTGGNGGGFGAPFRLTSRPGPRNTGIPGASRMHRGWDWAAPTGTPIPSVTNGIVTRNSWHPLSGKFVEVRSGSNIHRYQHNSRNAVNVGQHVVKGQTVGYVGSTGVSSGAHLHYEVRKGFANGTNGPLKNATTAWVGERGPELMHLSKGTEIFSNKESKSMVSKGIPSAAPSSGGAVHFNPEINISIQGAPDDGVIENLKNMIRKEMEEQYERFSRQMAFSREG